MMVWQKKKFRIKSNENFFTATVDLLQLAINNCVESIKQVQKEFFYLVKKKRKNFKNFIKGEEKSFMNIVGLY